MSENMDSSKVLKAINSSVQDEQQNGLLLLKSAIENTMIKLGITLNSEEQLYKVYNTFMDGIGDRVKKYNLCTDTESFTECFKERDGVVINTFHGVKGEEFDTVIAFGLLYGYIPHWNTIYNKSTKYQEEETKKLLYVVCSRAKKNLYLFAETGRVTQAGNLLEPTEEIATINYQYDRLD